MQITSINTAPKIFNKPNFRQGSSGKSFAFTDNFISETKKLTEKTREGNWMAKTFRSATAGWAAAAILIGYDAFALFKINKLKNVPYKRQKMARKLLAGMAGVGAIAVAAFITIQKLLDTTIDNSIKRNEELFNKLNKTNAKFNPKKMNSSYVGAFYDVLSGKVSVNSTYTNDPIGKMQLKKLLKHELEHAKQFEMIASLDNGIEKLNEVVLDSYKEAMFKTPNAVNEINIMYEELKKDTEGKYDKITVPLGIGGAEVPVKAFVNGLKIMMEDKNYDYKKLPMIIDKKHYEEAIGKRGKLNEEEKKLAEKYLEAYKDYPSLNFWQTINPFSKYKNNILEKEARKASRRKD